MKRVVITGMGIYSVIGTNLDTVKKSLENGKSGIVFEEERRKMGFRSGLTGKLKRPDLKKQLSRRMRIGLAEQGEYAYVATKDAILQAKLTESDLNSNSTGILFGNDSSAKAVIDGWETFKEKKDTSLMGSAGIFQQMNSTVTMNLSVIFKVKGINFSVSGACASSSHAIGVAAMMIKQGMQDIIICGGAQEINPPVTASFDGLGAFSTKEEEPEKALRPFDKDRDGLVPSGGAAVIILESYENAVKRKADIIGEVLGWGFSSNADHISNPSVAGLRQSMESAIKNANIKVSDIDYVNAHATSTPAGDSKEAQAIYETLGSKVPVSSTKSMTGHEMWAGGTSEVIYSLLMAHNDFIAPNINFKNPDEFSKNINIIAEPKKHKTDIFLSNSFGFGGTNSSLIIKKL